MSEGLPKGWVSCTLGDVLIFKNGYAFNSNIYSKEGLPLIRISNIQDGKVIIDDTVCIPNPHMKDDFIIENGDLLLALSGATTGKWGVFESKRKCLLNQRVGNLKVLSSALLIPKYRNNYVSSIRKEIEIAAYGGAQPNISPATLSKINIPLPPLNEQKRIVAKLDAIMPRIEAVKARLDEITVIENQILLSFLFSSESQYKLKDIGEYCLECNERYGKSKADIRTIGVDKEKGITDLRSSAKNYSNYKIVHSGDFIYNPMRVNIGSIAIYNGNEKCITSPDYVVFKTTKELSSALLLRYLKCNQGLLEIGHNSQGSVRSRLYFENLSKVKMPIAPIDKQRKAEKIFFAFSKIQERKNNILYTLDKLSQSVLAKAFRGELVPQDPNDEPAEKLLERILEEKAKMEAELKGTRKRGSKK